MRTVNEILDRFEREHLPGLSPQTKYNYERHILTLRRHFGSKRVPLPRAEITEFMNVPRAKMQRNKLLSVLSSAFREAMKWGWVDVNPCSGIERHEAHRRNRQLTGEEFEAAKVLARKTSGSGDRTALVMDLAYQTCQLQGNVLALRWSQVHSDRGQILFRNKVARKKIVVSITPEIRSLLERARRLAGNSEFVVSTSKTGTRYTNQGFRALWQNFMKTWEQTGNDRFTFFDIQKLGLAARRQTPQDVEETIEQYPQFEAIVRADAQRMSRHYQVFYCLEQSIRKLITDTMLSALGDKWWDTPMVPAQIKQEVAALQSKEVDSGMTRRSDRDIDYTTFGQLSQIITQNWSVFEKVFTSPKAVNRVMSGLNLLRGPIAHCCPVSDHEAERLGFAVKDWFNLRLTE